MTAGADQVVPISDDPPEFAVHFCGQLLPGRFAKLDEAVEHLGLLQEWLRTGKCPIVGEQRGVGSVGRPPGRPVGSAA